MKQLVFGKSGWTSVIGYVLAGLTALDELLKAGETSWVKIAMAVALAVFGRVAADSKTASKI